ncbi:MAG: HAL/PAL/TAL family ammonia-lyase [Natronosporangium sp.]
MTGTLVPDLAPAPDDPPAGPPPGDPVLDGRSLTVAMVVHVAGHPFSRVRLAMDAVDRLHESRSLLRSLLDQGRPIYGVTTGFGDSADRQITATSAAELQRNMIRYHLNGVGPTTPPEVVRATLLIRANCLARGSSAVNPAIVQRLLDLLRHDALPVIPERGSVGASGDLVPMCYIAAALSGEGELALDGVVRPATEVLARLAIPVTDPEAKDGLALINGTSFSAAFAALALAEAAELAVVAEAATALAAEALTGNRGHYAAFIHEAKAHPGQVRSAAVIRRLLADSGLALDHSQVLELNEPLGGQGFQRLRRTIQDRYSLRCAPHVIGVLRDTISWAGQWLETEINSSNDNPLFDVGAGMVHSGGNFYGGHVAQAMDALKVAVASVADLLDRQVGLLVDEKFNNGLTPNLVSADLDRRQAGLHHGFKGMQLAGSAVAAEALAGCLPVSIFSRSTEAHNQDKVSMSPIAARSARAVVGLAQEMAAIHLVTACQAVDLRGADRAGRWTRQVRDLIRGVSPPVAGDRRLDGDVAAVLALIRNRRISPIVDAAADTGGSHE